MDEEKQKTVGFLNEDKENPYEEKIGKYWAIYPSGTPHIFSGKIRIMTDRVIILKPFKGLKFDRKKGKNLYTLVEKDFEMGYNPNQIYNFEPSTKEVLLEMCRTQNNEIFEDGKGG